MIETVSIVGAGALGTVVGDALVKGLGAEKVRFLADGERLERCREQGMRYNGERCDFRFSDGTEEGPADLLIFAVKGPALEAAMALAEPVVGPDTIILSLLGGISSEETLSLRFGWDKVLYAVTQGLAPVREGNAVVCEGEGTLFLGLPQEDYFDREEKLSETVAFLARAGLPVQREEDILRRMWSQFMWNVGLGQVCLAYETDCAGVQQPGEARETMTAAMNEVRKVSACQGVLLTQKDLQACLAAVDAMPPAAIPAMRRDGLAGRESEVELFAGTVLALASRFGMRVPANETLHQKIKKIETNCGNPLDQG